MMDQPELLKIFANGVELAVWQWGGRDPAILFAHATGFHGRVWDRIIEKIPEREKFPMQRCLSIDLRGHGRSGKPAPPYPWRKFGEDAAAVAAQLQLRDAIGVAHSIGGHSMALAAALRPEAFRSLLLIDPVIQEPEKYNSAPTNVDFIAKRRAKWGSAEEMFERFRSRPPFTHWKSEILRDYCEYGLLPASDGDGLELACPPEIEASIYPRWNLPEADIAAEVATIRQSTIVVRSGRRMTDAKFDLSTSATDPALASRMPNARDVVLREASHFIPMETPEVVVDLIQSVL